jgi:hypothetical protein
MLRAPRADAELCKRSASRTSLRRCCHSAAVSKAGVPRLPPSPRRRTTTDRRAGCDYPPAGDWQPPLTDKSSSTSETPALDHSSCCCPGPVRSGCTFRPAQLARRIAAPRPTLVTALHLLRAWCSPLVRTTLWHAHPPAALNRFRERGTWDQASDTTTASSSSRRLSREVASQERGRRGEELTGPLSGTDHQ